MKFILLAFRPVVTKCQFFHYFSRLFSETQFWTFLKMSKFQNPKKLLEEKTAFMKKFKCLAGFILALIKIPLYILVLHVI